MCVCACANVIQFFLIFYGEENIKNDDKFCSTLVDRSHLLSKWWWLAEMHLRHAKDENAYHINHMSEFTVLNLQ